MTATVGSMPKATIQMTLRLDPELFEAITEAARKAGLPVVQWMAEAARTKLGQKG
jgi:predicted HicB family RNase H-like nuclease